MAKVSKKFQVMKVASVYNDVEITLSEYCNVKPPKPTKEDVERPPREPQIEMQTIPQSDEDRVALKLITAVKKYAPGLTSTFDGHPTSPEPSHFVLAPMRSLTQLEMLLSPEDYKKLGKPAVYDIVEVTLAVNSS